MSKPKILPFLPFVITGPVVALGLIVVLVLVVSGCGDDDVDTPQQAYSELTCIPAWDGALLYYSAWRLPTSH